MALGDPFDPKTDLIKKGEQASFVPLEPPPLTELSGDRRRIKKSAIYRHKACEAKAGHKVVWKPQFTVDVIKSQVPSKMRDAPPLNKTTLKWWYHRPNEKWGFFYEGPPQTPCPECGKLVSGNAIKGIKNNDIPCTAKCVAATGPNCECTCGGANHGGAYAGGA